MEKDTIVAKVYDLLKTSVPFIAKLARSHKFTYGDRVQNMLSDLLELMIEAYYAPANQKRPILNKIRVVAAVANGGKIRPFSTTRRLFWGA